jgi:hypothetical protein
MKAETTREKLNALLGLLDDDETAAVVEKVQEEKARQEQSRVGIHVGIPEAEIQKFREMQGIIYFLMAPQLWQSKTCPNCGIPFMVSRLFVAYCSYDCINESLRNILGNDWSRLDDLEKVVVDPQVYDGNEPIWIRNIPRFKKVLASLIEYETPEQ